MENMAKNSGTKVIFVDKSTSSGDRQNLIEALEAQSFQGSQDKK
jgi:hypothetical protein